MKKRTLRSNQETDEGKRCAALANSLTKKAPYKGGIIPPWHEWPPTGGSHGKLHRTTKILSHARRRGGRVAGWGARAAAGDAGDRAPRKHIGTKIRRTGGGVSAGPPGSRLPRGRE